MTIKSPFNLRQKASFQETSKGKISNGKSSGSTNESIEGDRKAFTKLSPNQVSNQNMVKNWTSTDNFKNKIFVSSY